MFKNSDIKIEEDEVLDDLQLKDLHIIQKKKGFKFGVDAVILADFANIKSKHRVVDLCSGTGIVPFLVYGRYNPCEITGIEIQKDMCEMAEKSIKLNGLENKINFLNMDLKDEKELKKLGRFDILTVNPPYKLNNSGIINPSDTIAAARHEIMCCLEDVIKAARILLKDNGRMFMVHRPDRLADIFCLMRKYKIEPKRVKMVYPKYKKAANIVLVEGQRDGGASLKWDEPLYVHNEDNSYTEEIDRIYGRDKNV